MDNNILYEFVELCNRISPENLFEDGEASPARAKEKHRRIMQEWAMLEARLGRQVTEEEVLGEYVKRRMCV